MNNTTVDSSPGMEVAMEPENWTTTVVFYLVLSGLVGLVSNVRLIVCLINDPKFRTRFYVILICLSANRACVSFDYTIVFVHRALTLLGLVSLRQYRIVCHSVHLLLYYSYTDIYLLIFLVVECMLAISYPAYYRMLRVAQSMLVCGVLQTLGVIMHLIPSYFGNDLMQEIECISVDSSTSAAYKTYINVETIAFTAVLVSVQVGALLITWRRMSSVNRMFTETSQTSFLRQQASLLAILRNMVFGQAGFFLIERGFVTAQQFVVPELRDRLNMLATMVNSIRVATAVPIIVLSKGEVRRAFIPKCLQRTRAIGSM